MSCCPAKEEQKQKCLSMTHEERLAHIKKRKCQTYGMIAAG
eukprot:CAMPEP_0194383892 /NCGR_PEP_ID=MMETSP0174-20130528/70488_1 /TAXON_ID=216777 /ORGANISM="Proboscia alata, Strain PI-D3" /LENGTH=40 /DNA_ID= /DNA_START= /DNA_END= /DNA_ORIENTATION=